MVQLWIPAAELKADLEDQAKKRLEEIQREAEKRRNQIVEGAQSKLNDTRLQEATTRFNEMVDPLFQKGREALEGAASGVTDTAAEAQRLFEEAQQSLRSEQPQPGLDGQAQPQAQTPPSPIPDETAQPYTPPATPPQLPGQEGINSLVGGISGALNGMGLPKPQAPQPLAPPSEPALPPPPDQSAMVPPGMPGGAPPPEPPGFQPPGTGLGNALAERIRGGMDAAGQGIGDQVTQGRDQAMELANKSLDIARDAMTRGGDAFAQTPVARAVTDANSFRPPGAGAIRDAAMPLFTGPSAASKVAEEIAPWTPEMQRNQEAWEGYQGQEREGAGLGGLLEGAGRAAHKFEQQTREQGETMLGKGTQGEGPLQQAQAAFGYAMAPYGALPEMARGGVEEATGSPLAGAAAYGAASILGPGGIRTFMREGTELGMRMLTNRALIPEIIRSDPKGVAKAVALAGGFLGGTAAGGKSALDAIREGKTPQEAVAEAVTTASDWLQISEAAGIPIEGVAKIWGVLPKLGIQPPKLPGMPRPPSVPDLPGMPARPGAPGEPAPETRPSLPEERAPDEVVTPDEGLDGVAGRLPGESAAAIQARMRTRLQAERDAPSPGIEEAPSAAQSFQAQSEATGRAADEVQRRQGPLGFLQRFGENLAGAQGQGPEQGVLFGNAPTTAVVGRGDEARRVGAIEQTIGGPAGAAPTGVTGTEGEALRPGRVIPETEISRFGQIRRGSETISPETGALTGTIEDRLLREYKKRDLTVEEEKALGVGAPGDPQRPGLAGEPRVASFRHPGWMARNYTPDYDAKLMHFEIPDKEAMAVQHPTWKAHLRTGSKGAYEYALIRPKKGGSALDALDEGDDAAPGEKKGTKVLYDTATGQEINITRHPEMPWKRGQMPITDTTGMTRDGKIEEVASTPLSYQRAALLRGLGLRNFYPDYGRFFGENLGRNSPTLFKELNAIFGAVASQASPETNLQRALAVMTAGRDFYLRNGRTPDFNELTVLTSTNFDGGRMRYTDTVTDADLGKFPAGGITGADVKKVIEIWDTGGADIGAGWKTPVFGQNLESGALNRADPLSVPDTHMFRGRGHTMTGGGPSNSVNSDLRALGITNATVVRLADEFGLTPFQVQSALWFVYKNELAPFNATDKAQIRNKSGSSDEGSPEYLAEAAKHDPWPKAMEEGPDGPRPMTVPGPDGTPMEVRQGTLPAVLRHVAGVAGRMPTQVKGQPKVARPRMDLMKAFRDLDTEFAQKVGRDSLTEAAGDARLTFNGKLVGNPSRGGTVDLDIPGEGTQRVRSMEITPENIERAAFKLSQEAPVAIVPMDGVDGNGLGRLGYDSQRGQIEALREASIPHQVVLTNRPFTAGEPGKAETKSTARVIFPGASLDTARYAASLLGQRAGADEVAVSWPTRPGAGRPVVSIEHPEGLEWTTGEIAKYPWASTLVGRANVSPDGRTLFFADLKPEEGKSVPWAERVEAVLEDADVPADLVRRSADFGIERVGADQYGEVLSRAPLQTAGEVGQRAQAQFEAGEAVPGSTPTNPDLREYAGPERFRPEGAPVGSLGIRDGQPPIRDSLDEKLQMGQMVAGAAAGAKAGDDYDDDDEDWQRATRIAGGAIGGALGGANAPNARRIFRAAMAARAFPPAREGALARAAQVGQSLSGDDGTFGVRAKSIDPEQVPEGLDAAHVLRANQSARGESFTKNAVTPRHLVATATPEEAGAVLDFGSGDEVVHTKKLRALGYDVTAHEFGVNQKEGLHDPEALTRQYDTVYANSVVNTQSTPEMLDRTLGEIAGATKPDGRALINYPSGPWYMTDMTPATMLEHIQQRFGSVEKVGGSNSRPIWEARDPIAVEAPVAEAPRNAPKGPPAEGTLPAPQRGVSRGEELGLGDLTDPENLSDLLINPPKGLTGDQIQEIGRAAFHRLRSGMTSEQTVQQRESERVRRLARRNEGVQKVEQATTPEEVADAAAEAEDAAKRGDIPHTDADAVRGRAARKLQQQKGEDGPPPPGEIDRQIAASRARTGAPSPDEAPEAVAAEPPKPPPAEVWRDMGDLTDEGVTVTETPEEAAARIRRRQRALEEEEGVEQDRTARAPTQARVTSGSKDEAARLAAARATQRRAGAVETPPPVQEPGREVPPTDMARVEQQSTAPFPEAEPEPVGRGPELEPYVRATDLGQTPGRVSSGSKAERDALAASRAHARSPEARAATPVTSPETEAALAATPTEPAERKIPRLVAPDGTILTRAQAAAQLARDTARPGGWGALRDEWNEGLSDAGKMLAAGGRGVKVTPKEMDGALAQLGQGNGNGGRGPGGTTVEGMSPRDREAMVKFRPEHVFDALGTMMRMNLVVTPEGFGRNFFSTTAALPFRFYEAATAPLFDRMWGVLPGQGDRGPNAAYSSEAVAMAEGLYRSWAAGMANAMNVMRKGDPKLTEAQMGDPGRESDFQGTAVGKAMGTFFRPMTATDAMLKTVNEGMEAYRLAHRQARGEFDAGKLGKDGSARAIRSRMIEIMMTPDQAFIDKVQQAGEYNTYNQKAGHIANLLEGFKSLPKGTPPAVQSAWRLMMNVVIPFVRISTNVMKWGLERTVPGGAISTALGSGRADRSERFAKMSEGALTLAGLWGAQQAGWIEVSGALPEDPDERDEWEMQGKTPFSMRVGDRWYDPRAIPGLYENVAMLGTMTDAKRKVDEKEARGEDVGAGDFLSAIPNAIPQYLGQVGVRPAFGGVVDALGMMTASNDRDKDYHASRLKRSVVSQLLPASGVARQVGDWTDPYQRDAKSVPEMAAAIYPFFRENLPEKLDARGAPISSERSENALAGLTSSRAVREDALLPREYLGSESAVMDAQIGSAIRAVQLYDSDPRANPRPTTAQRNLYYRFRSRKNPARQRMNKAADRLDFRNKSVHADLAEEGLFEFRAPTGLAETPDRLRELVGR